MSLNNDSVPSYTILRADERQIWKDPAVLSRQSFPATGNFDLHDAAYGTLLIHNDDIVSPGEGFYMHQHKDMEIISWIIDGRIEHRDSQNMSTRILLNPFQAQAISAGTGVRHTEVNAHTYTSRKNLRVIQMWIEPEHRGITPRHTEADFRPLLDVPTPITFNVAVGSDGRVVDNNLTPAAPTPLKINSRGTELQVSRLSPDDNVDIPAAHFAHIFIATGEAQFSPVPSDKQSNQDSEENPEESSLHNELHSLREGDTIRAINQALRLHATGEQEVLILSWYMDHSVNTQTSSKKS